VDLRWKLKLKLGVPESPEEELRNKLRLRHWSSSYPPLFHASGWPQPLTALRARLRHVLYPAEEEPLAILAYTVMVLNLSAVFQLCNWTTFAHFLLIDKSDEHQLVLYILANKGYHFIVYGAIQLVQNATAYFNCVLEDTGGRHPCSDGAPGRNVDYFTEFCFEQLRIATVWYAFRQLRSSNGGPDHLLKLERSRLMAATAGRIEEVLSPKAYGLQDSKRSGGVLRVMFQYDVACFALCYGVGLLNLWRKIANWHCAPEDEPRCHAHFIHPIHENSTLPSFIEEISLFRDWRFWMTLDFSETTYSLLAFPFFLLWLRPLRKYLVGSKPTGYDRRGVLCAELDFAEKVKREMVQQEEAEENRAATKLQARIRGAQARKR